MRKNKRPNKLLQLFIGVALVMISSAFIDRLNDRINESRALASLSELHGIPADYQLLFEENFENPSTFSNFEMTDPASWRIHHGEDNKALELFGKSDYKPRVRSPRNIAFIKDLEVGDFILEADLRQTGREYGHRDMCLFFGMKDPSNFYYVHLASVADPNAHNIFLVNDAPRTNIALKTTEGISWGEDNEDNWHKIRIERSIEDGKILVYFDDMDTPIMEGEDTHFDYGHIGFGSFDDTGMVDNIRIWAPEKAPEKKGFFW